MTAVWPEKPTGAEQHLQMKEQLTLLVLLNFLYQIKGDEQEIN